MVVGGRHQDFCSCSVDEEGRVVSIHEVAEVFTANLNPGFVFHMPQDPIDGDARTQPYLTPDVISKRSDKF